MGYVVVGISLAFMMFISASCKLLLIRGAVHVIHEVVGVPMRWLPVLPACEIAGGLGLLIGIVRPKLGLAAAIGLCIYFVGAVVAHVMAGDYVGLKAPIAPLVLSGPALVLRTQSMPDA